MPVCRLILSGLVWPTERAAFPCWPRPVTSALIRLQRGQTADFTSTSMPFRAAASSDPGGGINRLGSRTREHQLVDLPRAIENHFGGGTFQNALGSVAIRSNQRIKLDAWFAPRVPIFQQRLRPSPPNLHPVWKHDSGSAGAGSSQLSNLCRGKLEQRFR